MEGPNQPIDDATVLKREKFTVKTLSQIADRIMADYSGEFSHWNFSHKVRRKVGHYLDDAETSANGNDDSRLASPKPKYVEYWRATQLQGSASRVRDILNIIPPKSIAMFLALLAIGTQFAHMGSGDLAVTTAGNGEDEIMEREAGTVFYEAATTLLPDVITMASLESVQACLLLAHYTLPLDAHGLAYTYLGLAIKMAIQNGMHRKPRGVELDSWTVEMRNRLWWTAFTLERRVSVLHGRPASITAMEMDTELPQDLPEFRQDGQVSHYENMMAMIHLTGNLGDIATALTFLKRCPKHLQSTYFDRILLIREKLSIWWSSLPEDVQTPVESSPLFRANTHLKLNYHLVQIFTGRPFIFLESSSSKGIGNNIPRQNRRAILVLDALEAAFDTIDLLEVLYETTGLARASYTEFSSCRASLLLILAHSLNHTNERSRMAVRQGMRFIKTMSVGNNMSTKSEASLIETIEAAVQRIYSRRSSSSGEHGVGKQELHGSYDKFKEWTTLFAGGGGFATESPPVSNSSGVSNGATAGWHDEATAMVDLMNWTERLDGDIETRVSGDVFSDGQINLVDTDTLEINWGDFGWHGST
ncbi:c6 zinc finger domain containing protein [Fusarium flagelliforme]|uniref:C6 zinc finger domain containing protein n=1 Tax=Fusarium flagelliforme TaxID=2675880 RepID=A0A395N0H0_9HYPO|nr:c6 zinc finger domain containing protein [Fusarium flagelliforme]